MKDKPTAYAAMITISLPGTDQTATASLRVLPEEPVTLPMGAKLLRDCTLADLQTFANTWEAEVWETYQHIKLLNLEEEKAIQVEVLLIGQEGEQSVTDWANRAVVLASMEGAKEPEPVPATAVVENLPTVPTQTEAESLAMVAPPDVAEEPQEDTRQEKIAPPVAEEAVPITPPSPPPVPPTTEESPEVIVSKSEPVYVDELEELEPATKFPLPPRPQVRIAGKQMPLNLARWAAVDIFIEEPALRQAQAHALSSPTREVAGVLVGPRPEKQPDGRYNVYVTDTIIAKYTVMQGASVTYTPESWRYMNDQLWQRYPDESAIMVGWYHTHPGFGIFLSGMDQFIHQNFFTQTWHVALVLDPIAKTSGFFCWDRHHSRVNRYDFPWPTWAADW